MTRQLSSDHDDRQTQQICPNPEICPRCTENDDCIYFRNQLKHELLKLLEKRVELAGTCLVNIRNLSRVLSRQIPISQKRLSKFIDEVLTFIKAEQWGNTCSQYRLEKWGVRTISSKVYQIDAVTLEKLRWYIDR